jgi:hypothetical protein
MRSVLTLALLISWCASTDAAPVRRFKRPEGHMPQEPRPTVPEGLRCSRLDRRRNSAVAV